MLSGDWRQLAWKPGDTTNLSFRDEIRVMSVSADDIATPQNSYKPYQAYLYYGNYPLARPIYVLLNDPRNALPWGFASFLTSDRGQRIILKSDSFRLPSRFVLWT